MAKIQDVEAIYQLAYLSSQGEARKVIREIKNNSKTFPTGVQIKRGLIKSKKLTKIEKYDKLKNLTIKDNEELEDFNCNYLQLYQQIDAKLKDGITVQDYLKSRTRKEVCRIVLLDQCTTIEEAIKSAEKILKVWEFESLFSEENKPTYRGYQSHSYFNIAKINIITHKNSKFIYTVPTK